ncbi:pre-rrna-processing protein tsr2 [Moniliophthora roreri MCA 2997]|uniref:Pre-rrna-processing protein tsr2 n=2 Tax=Moniliophthora roreri TaxID=221103 RepID=V2XFW0_MONRO|nr:pre-rrna-processing protein tsr2 [Moniliophthora roreri MCA 2997]KAI3622399.1 pre-rrna-processing protein tsr2 [Moniliophthora roreri]
MSGQSASSPPSTSVLFARGVVARLSTWSILRTAVQESWGGPNAAQKRTWLAGVIVDAFEEEAETPDDQYIEEMLVQVMTDEFEVLVEDGSAESVAKDIVAMWDDVQAGKGDALVQRWEEKADKLKGKQEVVDIKKGAEEVDDDDWEDDEEDDEDAMDEDEQVPQLIERPPPRRKEEPVIDEDGFTLVKGKGRR